MLILFSYRWHTTPKKSTEPRPDWNSRHCCPPRIIINPLPLLDFCGLQHWHLRMTSSCQHSLSSFCLEAKLTTTELTDYRDSMWPKKKNKKKPVWPIKLPGMWFPSLFYSVPSCVSSLLPSLHSFLFSHSFSALPPSPTSTSFIPSLHPYLHLSLPPPCSIFYTLIFSLSPKALYKTGNCSVTEICTHPALEGNLLLVISKIVL